MTNTTQLYTVHSDVDPRFNGIIVKKIRCKDGFSDVVAVDARGSLLTSGTFGDIDSGMRLQEGDFNAADATLFVSIQP